MIRSGTTRFFDMYWHGAEAARAVVDSGLRAAISTVMIDQLDPARGESMRAEVLESLDRVADAGPRVSPSLGPHAIYTVSSESLAWLAEVAAEREISLQIHLSETEDEVTDCVEAHGKRPAAYLDELGFLGPRTVLAHGVWLDEDELELIAAREATVVANPAANMKLAVGGVLPYPAAARAGVRLGLGTDGVSSNSNLDSFEEVKLFALIPEARQRRPLDAARRRGPGDRARMALRRRSAARRSRRASPPTSSCSAARTRSSRPATSTADLVYAAGGSVVDTTVVAGRVLMRNRVAPGADELVAEVRSRAARLTA